MDCSLPGCSVHGILQTRILEWVAISFSRGFSQPLLLLSRFSRVRLCDPIDGSPVVSSVPGILQARILEWVAISLSSAWKWKVKVKSLSRARLLATPWTTAYQAPPSMGFSRQEYWSWVALPSPALRIEGRIFNNQKKSREGRRPPSSTFSFTFCPIWINWDFHGVI